MNITLIGAGAMGSTIGGFLSESGANVYFVDPFEAHVKAINEKGLIYEVNGKVKTAKIKAYTSADQIDEKMDLIIFLVKGLFTDTAAQASVGLASDDTYILTAQNGVGNVEILEKYFSKDKLLQGMIEFGAKMVEPGHVSALISPTAKVIIGPVNRVINGRIKEIGEYFTKSGLNFAVHENMDPDIWYKMTKNCSSNPICAIVKLPLGPYKDCPEGSDIEKEIISEVRAVAIEVPPDPGVAAGKKLTSDNPMYHHLPSTAQDVKGRKKTEIDFLNGAVVKYGEKYGAATPYNSMITALVKIIEKNYDAQF